MIAIYNPISDAWNNLILNIQKVNVLSDERQLIIVDGCLVFVGFVPFRGKDYVKTS